MQRNNLLEYVFNLINKMQILEGLGVTIIIFSWGIVTIAAQVRLSVPQVLSNMRIIAECSYFYRRSHCCVPTVVCNDVMCNEALHSYQI